MNKILFLILVTTLFTIACNKNCEYTETVGVNTTLPDTVSVGQTVSVNLDYGVGGCGGTPDLIETVDDKHRIIQMDVHVTKNENN